MENELVLTAYHESARVVFAYLNGYTCDSMELPGKGSNTNSKLNAGSDIKVVQAVLSGNPVSLAAAEMQHAIEAARKLMAIYCAGTCAKTFYQNDLKIPGELELDIPGQDATMIEKTQSFLKKADFDHPDDFPSQTIVAVFRTLKNPDVWKAVDLLASKVLKEDNALKRFYIEDTLMMAGMKVHRATAKSGFGLELHEDESVKSAVSETKDIHFEAANITPLNVLVKDFLKNIKSDWKEEELQAAIAYLHTVYKKFA